MRFAEPTFGVQLSGTVPDDFLNKSNNELERDLNYENFGQFLPTTMFSFELVFYLVVNHSNLESI